ncbi:alpha/beta fold hydrolase [Pseudonocardia endophytica]|uniref:Pimeloyl-ACP methyl ester carboxylesterase n=1 Tax=Pseudonocardia endophytica TaxID=401976 RepID=A0A4R1HGJ6_PSEEN|nr:alpha/beta hydrolase [Pseudonocardia endophytica]TCK19981.1 pimeloyl-ACP methyl ester carboxylesterase [Pseudonocardia endophytica]
MRWSLRSSDGVDLEVVEFGGTGRPVVLLHGLTGRATTWWAVARELVGHGRVVGLDARGHGRSGRPEPGDPDAWSPGRMAADVVELLERLGPSALVGHSMGGLAALLAASRRPDLVTAVVVEDMAVDLTALPSDAAGEYASAGQPFASLAAVREAFPGVGDYMTECVEERDDGYHLLVDLADATAIATHWTHTSHWDALDAIRAPTLLIEAEDSIVPPGQAEEMARRISGCEHVRIAGTGHLVHDGPHPRYLEVVHALLDRT